MDKVVQGVHSLLVKQRVPVDLQYEIEWDRLNEVFLWANLRKGARDRWNSWELKVPAWWSATMKALLNGCFHVCGALHILHYIKSLDVFTSL